VKEQGIYFYDLFDFFAIELNCSKKEIINLFNNNSKKTILEIFKKETPNFFYNDVRLHKPIKDSQGNILLYEDVEFTSYLSSLIDWTIKNPEKEIGPLEFQPTDSLVRHYKNKILSYFDSLISSLKNSRKNKYSAVFEKCDEIPNLQHIGSTLMGLIENVLKKPKGINVLIKAISKPNKSNPLEHTVNCAFICMAVMQTLHKRNSKLKIKYLGYSALFQNISDISNWNYDNTHPVVSAKIAEELDLPEQVIQTILNHHSLEDEKGILPVFNSKDKKIPEILTVLTNVNLFMDICDTTNLNCNELEIIKILWIASKNNFMNTNIVKAIAEIFLDTNSYKLLINHLKISEKCPESPLIWNIKGNNVPAKFICKKTQCKHLSNQTTIITKNIQYKHRERTIVFINKGVYYSCIKLDILKKNVMELIGKN
jgi:hypothetical protein